MFGLFYYDWTILIVIPAFFVSLWAQLKIQSTYRKYENVRSYRSMTGAEAARKILDGNGLSNVGIEHIRGHLTDHYDPKANVIRLSDSTYASTSVAAIGVAAHEAGHAVQHATGYFPIRIRASIIPITRFGSMLSIPLFFIGLIMASESLMLLGILFYSTVAFFQLVTLPVEFNASRRAMTTLRDSKMLRDDELSGARKVLSAAALTYVAALLTSLLTILRLLVLAGAGNRRR